MTHEIRAKICNEWKGLPLEEKEGYFPEPSQTSEVVDSVKLHTIQTRCSPERFKATVSEFTDEQKEACKALGFGALLEICGNRLRKHIVRYLVEGVDSRARTITIHGQTFGISPSDFSRCLGLANSGKEVSFAGSVEDHPELMSTVQRFSSKASKGMLVLKDVEDYLRRKDVDVDDKFRRLFVVYALSCILTPTASVTISRKWLMALRDTSLVHKQNWSEHCFNFLMIGIAEYTNDKTKGVEGESQASTVTDEEKRQTYMRGCALFLELFYFDCVVTPTQYVDKSLYPVSVWGEKQIAKLLAYTKSKGGLMSDKIQLRKPGDRLYVVSEAVDTGMAGRLSVLEAFVKDIKAETSQTTACVKDMKAETTACYKDLKAETAAAVEECKADTNAKFQELMAVLLDMRTAKPTADQQQFPRSPVSREKEVNNR